MSIELIKQLQQRQTAAPVVSPVQAIRDSREVPRDYRGGWLNRTEVPGSQSSMTSLAEWMGNNHMPMGYFPRQAPQRWQPSQSPMGGLNSGSWLQQYLARMNGE